MIVRIKNAPLELGPGTIGQLLERRVLFLRKEVDDRLVDIEGGTKSDLEKLRRMLPATQFEDVTGESPP